jgi:adenylate cyclase
LSDIFALQDDVTQSIVGQLQPELMQAEFRRSTRMPTENLDAWTLVHSARMRFQVGFDRDACADAVRLAEAALERDPEYAEAHGVLTLVIHEQVAGRWSDDPARDVERAAYHCGKALDLDPENPTVLFGAAFHSMHSGNPEAGVALAERSCAINPNDAFAQALRGLSLGLVGRGEEGLDAVDLALRLSPRDPRTYLLLYMKGGIYLGLGRYPEAERTHRLSIDLNNGFIWAWVFYATELAMQEKMAEATAALTELKKVAPDMRFEDWANTFKTFHGNPTGERGALLDRQLDSLRDIWPS